MTPLPQKCEELNKGDVSGWMMLMKIYEV